MLVNQEKVVIFVSMAALPQIPGQRGIPAKGCYLKGEIVSRPPFIWKVNSFRGQTRIWSWKISFVGVDTALAVWKFYKFGQIGWISKRYQAVKRSILGNVFGQISFKNATFGRGFFCPSSPNYPGKNERISHYSAAKHHKQWHLTTGI